MTVVEQIAHCTPLRALGHGAFSDASFLVANGSPMRAIFVGIVALFGHVYNINLDGNSDGQIPGLSGLRGVSGLPGMAGGRRLFV